jgi:hypothetical protein
MDEWKQPMAKATGEEREEEGVQIIAAREFLSVHGKIASFFFMHTHKKMATTCAAGSVKK